MTIRNIDENTPQAPEIPVEAIPDERLFLDGRIKDLFKRVAERKKAIYDLATRIRKPLKKRVAEITGEENIDEQWETIEEDSMAHYLAGNIECWIVRFGTEKYACQVFRDDLPHDAFVKRDFGDLARYLLKTYPLPADKPVDNPVPETKGREIRLNANVIKREPGLPPKMESLTT